MKNKNAATVPQNERKNRKKNVNKSFFFEINSA